MKQRRALLFALLFTSFAYFYQAGGWNQNSRFDLVRAIRSADETDRTVDLQIIRKRKSQSLTLRW